MNFLTPLYLLGALAIVAPIVFHLIRQTPTGEIPFSSLMFLQPSPPKVTKRSRVDHWLLLLLRAAALALLALAFARPFWRAVTPIDGGSERRRTLILVDTSASLRRGDLWAEALKQAEAALAAHEPADPLAIYAFDSSPRAVLSFADWAQLDPAARVAQASARLRGLQPSWRGTALGAALAEAVAVVAEGIDPASKPAQSPRRVVLVSDLQQGSQLDAADFAWPADVELELLTVSLPAGNAGVEALADAEEARGDTPGAAARPAPTPGEAGPPARVRVVNDAASKAESFRVGWVDAAGKHVGEPVTAYVPPGEGRVVRLPAPLVGPQAAPPTVLRLDGDPFPFDNAAYVAAARRVEETVLFLGPDASDDPNGLLYYLDRVFDSTPRRVVRVVNDPNKVDPKSPPGLIVVASEQASELAGSIRRQVEAGATALVVAGRAGKSATQATLLGVPTVEWADAPTGRDALLSNIRFDHPTFAPLAGPQFNDFTKIRFWRHRVAADPAATFADTQVLARFDDDAPALVEKPVGKGRVVVLASGWAPADGQLARSSKFVPLMAGLLDRPGAAPAEGRRYRVGDRVALADLGFPAGVGAVEVRKPDGSTQILPQGTGEFAATDAPGVYSAWAIGTDPTPPRPFAVNLDPAESRTGPLDPEALERQLGAKLAGSEARRALDAEALRQMQVAELEGRQKFWRYLVLGALALLLGETWLAGRVDRARLPRPAGPQGI